MWSWPWCFVTAIEKSLRQESSQEESSQSSSQEKVEQIEDQWLGKKRTNIKWHTIIPNSEVTDSPRKPARVHLLEEGGEEEEKEEEREVTMNPYK